MHREHAGRGPHRAGRLAALITAVLLVLPGAVSFGGASGSELPQQDGWGKLMGYAGCAGGIAVSVWRRDFPGLALALTLCAQRMKDETS